MSITPYEAVALYANQTSGASRSSSYLVLDLDTASVCVCVCSEEQGARMLAAQEGAEENSLWQDGLERLATALGLESTVELAQQLQDQLPTCNRALRHYVTSERLLDSAALTIGGQSISCAQLEQWLQPVGERLVALLQQGEQLTAEAGQTPVYLVPVGQAAQCYLTEYAIRAAFSADPLLPDDRIITAGFTQSKASILAQGMEYARQRERTAHTVTLVLRGAAGELQEAVLLPKGAAPIQGAPTHYVGPVYIAKGEPITVKVAEKTIQLPLPYDMTPLNSDLIDLAAGGTGQRVRLFIRSSRTPTRVFERDLSGELG